MKKFSVDRSAIHGKGIILNRDVPCGETIFIFRGKEVCDTGGEWQQRPSWLQVGYAHWVDPQKNVGRYLNHSCDPTAGIRGRKTVVALRPLTKGDEVAIDYSLSETYPLWHMRCRCGSANCRGILTPYQDLPHWIKRKRVLYTAKYIIDMKLHLSWKEYFTSKETAQL